MNWLWFILVGWWLAPLWISTALLMCWNPIGWAMAWKTPEIVFGET